MNEDKKWMIVAIQEALKAESEGEVPIGAVLVKNGFLISKGHNQSIAKHDISAHAEIQVLRSAGRLLKNYRLPETTIYVTLEPCVMCLSAIINARIGKIVFGTYTSKENFNDKAFISNKIQITGGIMQSECKLILDRFFNSKR